MIKIGISQARVLSCSIKIFLTAGSNNQAVADVLPATNRDKTKDIKILLKCFLTYSLYSLVKYFLSSWNSIYKFIELILKNNINPEILLNLKADKQSSGLFLLNFLIW